MFFRNHLMCVFFLIMYYTIVVFRKLYETNSNAVNIIVGMLI